MPFESKAQQRFMFAKHPRIAKRWADHTPDIKKLPEKKKMKKTSAELAMLSIKRAEEMTSEQEEREEAAGNPVTMEQVREFLRQNQAPEDSELHQWAESLGVSPSAAEELIYQLAAQQVTGKPPEDTVEGGPEEEEKEAEERIPGGKAEGMPASDFPADQLRKGIEVEKEHTPDPAVAKEIAKDHLEEFKNYYTALDSMEKRLKEGKTASAIADLVIKRAAEGCSTPGKKKRSQGKGRGKAVGGGKGPIGRMGAKLGAVLTQAKRDKLPTKSFALPKQEKYPIQDKTHAENALSRVSQHGTPAQRATVRSKVYSKYPALKSSFKAREGESPTSKENLKKEKLGAVRVEDLLRDLLER